VYSSRFVGSDEAQSLFESGLLPRVPGDGEALLAAQRLFEPGTGEVSRVVAAPSAGVGKGPPPPNDPAGPPTGLKAMTVTPFLEAPSAPARPVQV